MLTPPRPTASEDEIRLEQLRQRRRYPLWRLLRANARDIVLLVRQSWISLGRLASSALAAPTFAAAAVSRELLHVLSLPEGLLTRLEIRPELVVICTPQTPLELTAPLGARGVRVLRGDAREAGILEVAGLARAYALAALFGDDLTNLQIGLAARALRPDVHLVLPVFSDVLAERLAALFGIKTTYSTSALAAPTLAAAAVLREVEHAFDVGERLFAIETAAREGDILAGRTAAELREQSEALVVALRRGAQREPLPAREHRLEPGDEVVLLGELAALARLRAEQQK